MKIKIMFTKSTTISLMSTLTFLVAPAAFSDNSGSIELPSVAPNSVYIWNGVTKPVVFYLSVSGSQWNKFVLNQDQSNTYTISDKTPCAQVAIKTGDVVNKGKVCNKNRYRIAIKEDGTLDVLPLGPR